MPHLPDHQTDHDPLLIAAFAAGDAEGTDLERAQELVATCDDCADLHHDLRAIAAAMPAVPARARTRDFRLTPEQAQELRPSGWRRLLAPLAGPRFAFAAPLGGSLAALGLAGILVAGAASTPIAGTGSAVGGTGVDGGTGALASRDQRAPGGATPANELQVAAASTGPRGPLLPAGAPQPSAQPVQPGAATAASGAAAAASAAASGEPDPGAGTASPGDASASAGLATGSAGGASAEPDTSMGVPKASGDAGVDNMYAMDAAPNATGGPDGARTSAETLVQVQAASSLSPLVIGAAVLVVVGGVLVVARRVARRTP